MNLKTIHLEAMLATPTPAEAQAARQAEVDTSLAAVVPSLTPTLPGFEPPKEKSNIPSAIASGAPAFPMGDYGSSSCQDKHTVSGASRVADSPLAMS